MTVLVAAFGWRRLGYPTPPPDAAMDASSPIKSNAAPPLAPEEAAALFDAAFGGVPKILLAVSGGADSLAMLVTAAEWAASRSAPILAVATVDHGLRTEAAAEVAAVAAHAARLGFAHARLAAPLVDGARVEETARGLRYAALAKHARAIGAGAIATAHTLDDQAETMLMRLAAGSGPAGLAAMRGRSVREGGLVHLRPFLGLRKARLVATLRARGHDWAEDAMNADPAYLRPRLRAARAVLEGEGLTAERLGVFATRMTRIEDALAAAVDAAAAAHLAVADGGAAIAPEALALPAEIRLRLLARAVTVVGEGPVRLDRLERLFARTVEDPAGAATLAGARVAWTADGGVVVTRAAARRSPR